MKGRVSFEVESNGSLCSPDCKHLLHDWCNLFGRTLHQAGENAGGKYPVRLMMCERADFTSSVEVKDERT